ncbi:MAG: endonuclease/exonuclease/phosphatase family protein [Phycisphaerae bacterium]|nr:endonuclease/exonuclease/phosphatase family protein [Phycisphaerae bacterium]
MHFAFCISIAAAGPTSKPDVAPTDLSLKKLTVLTYNINGGMPEAAKTLRTIETADADIVCLQETNAQWEPVLRARLGRRYPHAVFRDAGIVSGLAVMSKFPIKLKAFDKPAGSWGPFMFIESQTPLGPVQLLNVHLSPAITREGKIPLALVVELPEIHRKEMAAAFAKIKPGDGPLIVLGDFNEFDGIGAAAWLHNEQRMIDALPQFDEKSPTWQWIQKSGPVTARLDHIAYRGLGCKSAAIVEGWSSDHRPVVATFVAKPSTTQGEKATP